MLTVSIVLFNTDFAQLIRCINSINNFSVERIFLIDNSPTNHLEAIVGLHTNVEYVFNPSNPGYGAAHNIALRRALQLPVKYHLVLNADVYFQAGTLDSLFEYMNHRDEVALVMPKILFPSGEIQYLCKLLPSPIDLLGRIFFPKNIWFKKNSKFEMRSTNYSSEMFVPYLSGCFMFLRVEALKECGLFDERFFMYPEDIDLTRRLAKKYATMFFPDVIVYHEYGAASKKSAKMFFVHAFNIIKYFNKWGWVFDSERVRLNKLAGQSSTCVRVLRR
jgi:GT2 family glycosyltransferase